MDNYMYIEAPNSPDTGDLVKIFLAGSIDMGQSEEWAVKLAAELEKLNLNPGIAVYNPRRKDWNNDWKQSIDDENFSEQVNWEQDHIDEADLVIFNFIKDSTAPISLMELGYVLGCGKLPMVVCPTGFYRKGNVDIMCNRAGIMVFETIDEVLSTIKQSM